MKILKRVLIGLLIGIIIFSYAVIFIPPFGEKVLGVILAPVFNYIGEVYQEGILEEQRKLENGEEVELRVGRDTCYQWENAYEIGRYGLTNEKRLEVHKGGPFAHLLGRIFDYSVYGEKLYIISYEGYAVIDRNRQCRIYITVPLKDFEEEKEYGINEKGERLFYTGKAENEYVTYIENFSDYSESEQKIIEKMIKKN